MAKGVLMSVRPLEVEQAVLALAGEYQPALEHRAQLELDLSRLIKAHKALGVVISLVTAHLAKGRPKDQAQQLKRDVARSAGSTAREVEGSVKAADALSQLPDAELAARQGRLSTTQLALVTEGAKGDPGAAAELVAVAERSSLKELADEVGRRLSAGPGAEERRKAAHAGRYLRAHTGSDGAWYLHAKGTVEDGAQVMAAITPLADRAFDQARKAGKRQEPDAYAFDGLVALATAGGAGRLNINLSVHMDWDCIIRGFPLEGERCEIVGVGPTTPQAVLALLGTGDPFIKAILTKGQDVVGVAHLGRRPNAYQRSALDWLFPTCAAEGCGASSSWLETDHREDWARTHFTVLGLLDRLCPRHHRMKTHQGWKLVDGKGKRPFVGPDDPRHPRHHQATAGPPGTSGISGISGTPPRATAGATAGAAPAEAGQRAGRATETSTSTSAGGTQVGTVVTPTGSALRLDLDDEQTGPSP